MTKPAGTATGGAGREKDSKDENFIPHVSRGANTGHWLGARCHDGQGVAEPSAGRNERTSEWSPGPYFRWPVVVCNDRPTACRRLGAAPTGLHVERWRLIISQRDPLRPAPRRWRLRAAQPNPARRSDVYSTYAISGIFRRKCGPVATAQRDQRACEDDLCMAPHRAATQKKPTVAQPWRRQACR